MKTIAILLDQNSKYNHINFALSEILKTNHRIILIYIQKDNLFTFSDPYLLFQCSFLYEEVRNKGKQLAREHLIAVEKNIAKKIDIEVCKMVVLGSEHYKLECVLKALNVECAIVECEQKLFGKKLGDRMNDWGIVVINVPISG